MTGASNHDRAVLLRQDISETASTAAHYLKLIGEYAYLGDDAGMRYSLKNAVTMIKATIGSFNDLAALKEAGSAASEAHP